VPLTKLELVLVLNKASTDNEGTLGPVAWSALEDEEDVDSVADSAEDDVAPESAEDDEFSCASWVWAANAVARLLVLGPASQRSVGLWDGTARATQAAVLADAGTRSSCSSLADVWHTPPQMDLMPDDMTDRRGGSC